MSEWADMQADAEYLAYCEEKLLENHDAHVVCWQDWLFDY